uniref:HECT domain-containing protein n=1 Tax=Latimeria chalumnae TaxID=7897 RepID=H2ZUW1_LATCH
SVECIACNRVLGSLSKKNIIQVACGNHHSLALSKEGQVFTWGQSTESLPKPGIKDSLQPTPQPVKHLEGIPLAQIAAGGAHSIVVSVSGAVYSWGKNDAGQLGLGHTNEVHCPTFIKALEQKKTVFVSCGEKHTVVLMKDGLVFTFGAGGYGQLGHNSTRNEVKPRLVAELLGAKVSQVACGRYRFHTIAFAAPPGKVYAFGCGEHGQLGNMRTCNQLIPLPGKNWHSGKSQCLSLDSSVQCFICLKKAPSSEVENIFSLSHFFPANNGCCSAEAADQFLHWADRYICSVEDELVENWLTTDSKQWKKIEKEINLVFSSAANVNGCFLEQSKDDHFKASTQKSALNLSAARLFFKKIARVPRVFNQVKAALQKLLTSFLDPAASVEAFRVFLIVPELLRVLKKKEEINELTRVLSEAILRLQKDKLQILESLWASLSTTFFKTLVTVCHCVSSQHLQKVVRDSSYNDLNQLHGTLRILQILYKVNLRAGLKIQESNFYLPELKNIFILHGDYLNSVWVNNYILPFEMYNSFILKDVLASLIPYPCIFDFESKLTMFNSDHEVAVSIDASQFHRTVTDNLFSKNEMSSSSPYNDLRVNRNNLIEDTLQALSQAEDYSLHKELLVDFLGETTNAKVGGVRREFFRYIFKEMLQPEYGMFVYIKESNLMWFPMNALVETNKYFQFGVLCGLMVYNHCLAYLPFPLALFKKLLDEKPSLEDFKELDNRYGKSLQYIHDYECNDLEEVLGYNFSAFWQNQEVELVPNGKDIPLTTTNKQKFIETFLNYVFNESVERLFDEFRRGLYKVCDREILEFFKPQELMAVMVGNADYDWQRLQQNTLYGGGYSPSHPTITMFWKVFHELPLDQKKAFLLFVTGSDRIPPCGMDGVRITIARSFGSNFHMPEAYTCYNMIQLPMYTTVEHLKERLLKAISYNSGFGIG